MTRCHFATISYLLSAAALQLLTSTVLQDVECIQFESPQLISSGYHNILCIKPDRYRPLVLILCVEHSVYKFHLSTREYEHIAGNYSDRGFRSGSVGEAQFNRVADLVQLGENRLVVSDSFNHCLRYIEHMQTTTLAGNCTTYGFNNGHLSESRFFQPRGLLVVDGKIFVADSKNNALRMIDLAGEKVSTFMRDESLKSPKYFACDTSHCSKIYITVGHGVATYNASTNLKSLTGKAIIGTSTGTFSETRFFYPTGLLVLSKESVVVSDSLNYRLLLLNLSEHVAQELFARTRGNEPLSLLCYNDSLYIGKKDGLHMLRLNRGPDDLNCFDPSMIGQVTTTAQQSVTTTEETSSPNGPHSQTPTWPGEGHNTTVIVVGVVTLGVVIIGVSIVIGVTITKVKGRQTLTSADQSLGVQRNRKQDHSDQYESQESEAYAYEEIPEASKLMNRVSYATNEVDKKGEKGENS